MIRAGIDVVDISRLEGLFERWPGLLTRLFTPIELEYANSRRRPADHLAARVAAKEATFKALGVGWPKLSWDQVWVVSKGRERPELHLRGKAAELAGPCESLVSLAHDGGIAVAQVILVTADPIGQ
jgi:holo-[acyl-carrier protein] synthase